MSTKKDLENYLTEKHSVEKPVIRRGQGMKLSTEEPSESPSRVIDENSQAANEETSVAGSTTILNSQKRTKAQSHNRTSAKKTDEAKTTLQPKRINRGYKLREDLIKGCKQVALNEDRKLYEVMEEALTQYLSQKGINQGKHV
jgi:hypothetical protein